MITREDLTIERGTTNWGSEMATVTVNLPRYWSTQTVTFLLRSTAGLTPLDAKDSGGGIHIHEGNERGQWHGVLHARDMEPALDEFVGYLNHLVDRDVMSRAYEVSDLDAVMTSFKNSLDYVTPRDFAEEWEKVKAAFRAIDVAYAAEREKVED